jgi:hypothetical protein
MDDREKAALSALTEDFKARWQELLNLENENNRWSTLYASALILIIGWMLNNSRYPNIDALLDTGENAYLVVSLAFINAIYTLAMTIKGYQIQQIALYLHEEVGQQISKLAGCQFNSWETWRRSRFQSGRRRGRPEWVRVFYYGAMSLLPLAVSLTILILYAVFQWHKHAWWQGPNFFFCVVLLMVAGTGVSALSTAGINRVWKETVDKDLAARLSVSADLHADSSETNREHGRR